MAAPVTTPSYMTRKAQVNVLPGDHLAFAAGHGYYDAPGAPHAAAAPTDPYAAIVAGMPKPLTGAQISSQAQGMISPLVAAATGTIGKQTAAATNAIKGYEADAAQKLGAIDYGAPYASAESGQAAVDAALRQQLAGAGTSGADDLSKRLAVINDPTVAAAAGALTANGAANGTTQVAQGSASLGNLLANAASAKTFGDQQPGIQRLAGLQEIAAAGQQGQAQIAAQAQALEAQLPSIVQNLQARNDARSQALTAAQENHVARIDAIASGQAASEAKAATTDANNATRLQIAQMNADGRASAAQVAQANSDRSYRLSFSKTFGFDPVTNQTIPGYTRNASGAVVKVGKAGSTAALTPASVQTFLKTLKTPTYTTVSKSDGNGGSTSTKVQTGDTYSMTFLQAYKHLRAGNVSDAQAREYLQSVYPRGEGGRAWLTNEEQAALQKAATQVSGPGVVGGLTRIRTVKDGKGVAHGYLTEQQANLLRADHKLPAGEAGVVNGGRVWYIAPNS